MKIHPSFTLLPQFCDLVSGPVYLVGGTVRDLLLGGTTIKDIDILMPAGSEDGARRFADVIGGSFFYLDEQRNITRVVKGDEAGTVQFDFTNFEGPDLAADLGRRDFTINAMALDLRLFLEQPSLERIIDLFGGREDVQAKVVRVTSQRVLNDDPLRLLRAARFAATLGFSIEKFTVDQIRARAQLILLPSPERVRDELFLILDAALPGRNIELLDSLGLLKRLLPELEPLRDFMPGKYHSHDIFTHSVKTARYADEVLDQLHLLVPRRRDAVLVHLGALLEQGVSRMAALRFAGLLHDIAKPETYSRDDAGDIHFYGHDQVGAEKAKEICGRFRLSRATEKTVERLVRHHMRPFGLSLPVRPSTHALYRYCRDLQDAVPESIILSLADAKATAEVMPAEGFTDTQQTGAAILDYYYEKFLRVEAKPLVTGRDLIGLGMKPGPRFRGILEDVRERQAAGTLQDRADALRYIKALQ